MWRMEGNRQRARKKGTRCGFREASSQSTVKKSKARAEERKDNAETHRTQIRLRFAGGEAWEGRSPKTERRPKQFRIETIQNSIRPDAIGGGGVGGLQSVAWYSLSFEAAGQLQMSSGRME